MPTSEGPDRATTAAETPDSLPSALMQLENEIESLSQLEEKASICRNEASLHLEELTGMEVDDRDGLEEPAMPENAEKPTNIVAKVHGFRRKLLQIARKVELELDATRERQERVSRALGIE